MLPLESGIAGPLAWRRKFTRILLQSDVFNETLIGQSCLFHAPLISPIPLDFICLAERRGVRQLLCDIFRVFFTLHAFRITCAKDDASRSFTACRDRHRPPFQRMIKSVAPPEPEMALLPPRAVTGARKREWVVQDSNLQPSA